METRKKWSLDDRIGLSICVQSTCSGQCTRVVEKDCSWGAPMPPMLKRWVQDASMSSWLCLTGGLDWWSCLAWSIWSVTSKSYSVISPLWH